jgi:hypothetical protein
MSVRWSTDGDDRESRRREGDIEVMDVFALPNRSLVHKQQQRQEVEMLFSTCAEPVG